MPGTVLSVKDTEAKKDPAPWEGHSYTHTHPLFFLLGPELKHTGPGQSSLSQISKSYINTSKTKRLFPPFVSGPTGAHLFS